MQQGKKIIDAIFISYFLLSIAVIFLKIEIFFEKICFLLVPFFGHRPVAYYN